MAYGGFRGAAVMQIMQVMHEWSHHMRCNASSMPAPQFAGETTRRPRAPRPQVIKRTAMDTSGPFHSSEKKNFRNSAVGRVFNRSWGKPSTRRRVGDQDG